MLGRVIKSSPTDLRTWGTSEHLSSSVLGWDAPPAGDVCGSKAGTKMLAVGLGCTAPTRGTTIQGQLRFLVGYRLVETRASSSKRRASSAVLMCLIPKQGGHLLLKQGEKPLLFCVGFRPYLKRGPNCSAIPTTQEVITLVLHRRKPWRW